MKSIPGTLRERWRRVQDVSHLRRWMSAAVLLLTVGFLVAVLIRGRHELSHFDDWHAYLTVCLQVFFLHPLSLSVQALIWSMIVARLGRMPSQWRDIEIYAYTHLMRRLPGALWYLAGRTVIYRERGITAGVTLTASGLEWLLLLMTAVLIYAGLSLSNLSSWLLGLVVLTLVVIAGLWGLSGRLRSAPGCSSLPGFAHRWLNALSMMEMPRAKDLFLWSGLYTIAYTIGGVALFLLVRGVVPESVVTLPKATSIWALTNGASLLTSVIVPAGLGIRELTLTALLAPDVPTVGALFVALLLRMVMIVGDLIWGSLMWAVAVVAGRNRRRANTYGEERQAPSTMHRPSKKAGVSGAEHRNTTNG